MIIQRISWDMNGLLVTIGIELSGNQALAVAQDSVVIPILPIAVELR